MTKNADYEMTLVNFYSAKIALAGIEIADLSELEEIFHNFGCRNIHKFSLKGDFMENFENFAFDLLLINAGTCDSAQFDFCKRVRNHTRDCVRYLQVILICSNARQVDAVKARDSGANIVITTPFSPKMLLDRIIWLAQDQRQFISCKNFIGPDRRKKRLRLPKQTEDRRAEASPEHVREAAGVNAPRFL